jgi:hypothetical protein
MMGFNTEVEYAFAVFLVLQCRRCEGRGEHIDPHFQWTACIACEDLRRRIELYRNGSTVRIEPV